MVDEDILTHEQLHPLLAKKLGKRVPMHQRKKMLGPVRNGERLRAERIADIAGECGLLVRQ